MTTGLTLFAALVMPVASFALLMWLAHLEDTLDRDVRAMQRQPDPPPILAIPVRRPAAEPVPQPEPQPQPVARPAVAIPEQRPAPVRPAVEARPTATPATPTT